MNTGLPSPIPDVDRRVLFVDDDHLALRAFERALSDTDVVVATASSAEAGLALFEEAPYPVVFSDFQMPGRNGIQFLARVRHAHPDTVCVLISGQADLHTAVQAVNRIGVFRFLLKPIDPEELRAAVRHACNQYELSQQRRLLTLAVDSFNAELRQLNRRLDDEVERRTELLLMGLLNALDLRDTETRGHSKRVSLYSGLLARQLGMDDASATEVERAALLHDIGKVGVSDTILRKPGTLSPEEFAEIQRHTIYGYDILGGLAFLGEARKLARSHHERYDGDGYPDGLAGEDIYLGARLFAVIDTYDAITTDRPYRKALSDDAARAEILAGRGTQLDPVCVDAFLDIPAEALAEIREAVAASGLDIEGAAEEATRGRSS